MVYLGSKINRMAQKDNTYQTYLIKSFTWVVGNAFFGLLPLLFMQFIYWVSENRLGKDEIDHLVHDGVVLFVCCAVLGAVLVEFILSGQRLKISETIRRIAIPIFIFVLILMDYFLINLKVIDKSCFDISSTTSSVVMVLSLYYCIFTKFRLYVKEETKYDTLW